MSEKIRTLIVDDSAIYRSQLRAALNTIPNMEVVGTASNGQTAIERLRTEPADFIVLDMEMPVLDGLQTLKEIRKIDTRCKILLFSSLTESGATITLEALKNGASDFVTKPSGSNSSNKQPHEYIRDLIEPKISALFDKKMFVSSAPKKNSLHVFRPRCIVVGSSTGGPNVLEDIFTNYNASIYCPILIAQHMPAVFTQALAARLNKLSGLTVKEAVDGEPLQNYVYIAPGDFHMEVAGSPSQPTLKVHKGPQEHFVRPAVDPLFKSASALFKQQCLGIVLTGMGSDGKKGAEVIKQNMGSIVIQTQASCVVFGMPGAIRSADLDDAELSPQEIRQLLYETASWQTAKGA